MQNQDVFSISEEFSKADFGDKRLTKRLGILADSLSCRPEESFPEAAGSIAALEATYRFLGNPKVTPDKILNPHVEATIERSCSSKTRVLVAHDTTTLTFPGEGRSELGWITSGGIGFLGHFSLAIARSEIVRPLGVVSIEPFFRTGKAKGKNPKRGKKQRSINESRRWWQSVEKTENLFPVDLNPIHIMDREADDYELFSHLYEEKIRFVIRIRQNRAKCQIPGEKRKAKISDLFTGLEVMCEREVAISKRNKSEFPQKKRDLQPRGARIAKLHIAATQIEIPRTIYQYADLPKSLTLNCVHVYEVDAPEEVEPVEWKLLTTEAIEKEEDVLNIVDDYRARWTIEEFFKALKTGCSYEKRQLESKESLLNALAVFAPIAWQLLVLRTLSRQNSTLSAEYALSKTQIEVLQAVSKKEISEKPTIQEAALAIAALGGHIPNNGPPGWIILGRGMETLLKMEIAWAAAKRTI